MANCKVRKITYNILLRILLYSARNGVRNWVRVCLQFLVHESGPHEPTPTLQQSKGTAALGANPSPSILTESISQYSTCVFSAQPAWCLYPSSLFGARSYLQMTLFLPSLWDSVIGTSDRNFWSLPRRSVDLPEWFSSILLALSSSYVLL